MRIAKNLLIGVAAALLLLAIVGRIYQTNSESRDLNAFPPPGQLVEVNGRLMHLDCRGAGSPTLIIEQGLGAGGLAQGWERIHSSLAERTRTCAYDRAGVGYSEPVDIPTRSQDVARNLSELLKKAGIDDSLILVGYSRGGVHIREFQKQYPDKVSGMVFVDSSHEQQYAYLPPAPSPPITENSLFLVAQYLQPLGWLRASGLVDAQVAAIYIPEDQRDRAHALYNRSHTISTLLNETRGVYLDAETLGTPVFLGDLPLLVITQGMPVESLANEAISASLDYLREQRRVWNELQSKLVSLSTGSKQVIATQSGHSIHATEPTLLVDSIIEFVASIEE